MSAGSYSSIAPYLPLHELEGSLRWMSAAEFALKSVVRGPDTSMVNTAMALYDFIEDIRNENGDLKPLSPQVSFGLHRLCNEMDDAEEFFNSTLPHIAELALELPDLLEHHEREIKRLSDGMTTPMMLRVLSSQESGVVLLHQHLIAALLACAFLCLYPHPRQQRKLGLVNINFDGLYLGVGKPSTVQKLLCLVHYFKRVGKRMPEGTVSFERKVLPLKISGLSAPDVSFWSNSKKPLCEIKIINDGSIEDAGPDYLQVDFANEQLGGGALNTGCVQEEIRFMVSPECIAGMLFLPTMTDNESIEIIGAETYSEHTGYGQSFRFTGDYTDNTPRDSWGRRTTCIGAIDALCLPGESQFEDEMMIRELNKAYCGFLSHSALCGYNGAPDLGSVQASEDCPPSVPDDYSNYEVRLDADSAESSFSFMDIDENTRQDRSQQAESTGSCVMHRNLKGVSTGNWGAGAFGGNLQLKSLLQWLAASQAGCSALLYYSFGDARAQRLQQVVDWIRQENWCVSELWTMVQEYGKCRINRRVKSEIYEWILPHESKEVYIPRTKVVRFTATSEQAEREEFLMMNPPSGRRQLTREVAPGKKTMGCWSWSRRRRRRK
ncbi:unnamed protein product [Calypogeia fissa]